MIIRLPQLAHRLNPDCSLFLSNKTGEGRKMLGRNTGPARKMLAYNEKYKVGFSLGLANFSKQGNLHFDVLTEIDGTHVEVARGVAIEHMSRRKATQVPE